MSPRSLPSLSVVVSIKSSKLVFGLSPRTLLVRPRIRSCERYLYPSLTSKSSEAFLRAEEPGALSKDRRFAKSFNVFSTMFIINSLFDKFNSGIKLINHISLLKESNKKWTVFKTDISSSFVCQTGPTTNQDQTVPCNTKLLIELFLDYACHGTVIFAVVSKFFNDLDCCNSSMF